ncbi:MAG: energy-coupling factor ABC transporter ATP-binding protein [Acidimicrobiia bacterium]
MSVPALEVVGLTFAYPDGTDVLRGADFHVHPGERVALLGPNGAGKTTLVLHLNGILRPTAGSVTVAGLPVIEDNLMEVRRRTGLVFQDPDDQLFMPTVRQDVAFGPANFGVGGAELEERVHDSLEAVGAEGTVDKAPHHLSGGERRRVAIATVLAMRPEILVLDEPTSNLDPAGRRELAEVLLGLGTTVLVVTHDLPFALELCPRSLVMSGGRIVADGPTAGLLADRELMRANRLELPFGFDPTSVGRAPDPVPGSKSQSGFRASRATPWPPIDAQER